MEEEEIIAIIERLKQEYLDEIYHLMDKTCPGCILIATAGAMAWYDHGDEKRANEIREFAKTFSGREDYCGECKHDLWNVPRNKAGALCKPWANPKPQKEGIFYGELRPVRGNRR